MYNIGDIVFVYLFDLNKSIHHTNKLRADRFGRIIDVYYRTIVGTNNNVQEIVYKIRLTNNNVIEYNNSNINYSMMSVNELVEFIGTADLSAEKRNGFLEQIQEYTKRF